MTSTATKSGFLLLLIVSLFPFSLINSQPERNAELFGASGIVRYGDELFIVSDKDAGVYYRYELKDDGGPRIRIDGARLQRISIPEASMALDLEGITILAGGRVAVLSEGLGALISEGKIIAEYPGSLGEFGGIGLEGVAARELPDGSSRLAVVWEGGYPQIEKSPVQLRERVGEISLHPLLVIHDVPRESRNARMKSDDLLIRELRVPRPVGKEPSVQRFRVPDLVWHRLNQDGDQQWGVIALLSSLNATQSPSYLYLWLQRYGTDGKPVGDHLDLKQILPPDLRSKNWEGMGWFEAGMSLILTFDNLPGEPAEAFVVELPESWKS